MLHWLVTVTMTIFLTPLLKGTCPLVRLCVQKAIAAPIAMFLLGSLAPPSSRCSAVLSTLILHCLALPLVITLRCMVQFIGRETKYR